MLQLTAAIDKTAPVFGNSLLVRRFRSVFFGTAGWRILVGQFGEYAIHHVGKSLTHGDRREKENNRRDGSHDHVLIGERISDQHKNSDRPANDHGPCKSKEYDDTQYFQ
jgi:hypothetical protein